MHVPVFLTVLNPWKYCKDLNGSGLEKLDFIKFRCFQMVYFFFYFTVDIWFLSLSCGAELSSY